MTLYHQDYYQWVSTQAALLKVGDFSHLDVAFLAEEIEDLGNSVKRALESYYRVLFCHLLKQKYQPEKATRSWSLSIKNAKKQIEKTLLQNPSLKYSLPIIRENAYESARLWAMAETNLEEEIFPEKIPEDFLTL